MNTGTLQRWLLPSLGLAGAAAFAAVAWLATTTPTFQPVDRPLSALPAARLDGTSLPSLAREPYAVVLVWMPG